MLMFNMFFMMFISGMLVFCFNHKHLLMMLLSMEFIILSVFMSMFFLLSLLTYEYYFCMIFMVMSVCESALGLSMLVSMVRIYGNDYFQVFSILW